ncbi:MAG: biotin/lipoate A/B protein ligase family protein [Candidatus Methylomirabilales bacterium]
MPGPGLRLLRHPPADGPWNMAVDEAIAASVGEGSSPPTLRLYGWQPPTVSLGYLQPAAALVPACRTLRIPLVRRPTGGRAVLHDQERTYSLALPWAPPWSLRSVPERFRLLAGGLIGGLARLGVEAVLADGREPAAGARAEAACFRVRRQPAVLCRGRKLAGAAERRFPTALLQHGSLLLRFDAALHGAVFPAWPSPERQVVWLEAVLGRLPDLERLDAALAAGWETALGLACRPGHLTPAEAEAARRLAAERYGASAWTLQR